MIATRKIPELAIPQSAPANAVEQARCLENAAKLVHGFARKCAPEALDALLAAGGSDRPGEALDLARSASDAASAQAETLLAEVERFMILTKPRAT